MTQPDATVLGVIQARMGSSRLPGKVLQPLHGRPVLSWVCRAARASTQLDDVVVATTTEQQDDAVVDWCAENEIAVVRGSTDDVLGRFLVVADAFRPDAIVRLTADCPLLDPALIDGVVGLWRARRADYVSTVVQRSLPRGLDVELVRADVLRQIDGLAVGHDRSHVTSYVYGHPERFDVMGVSVQPDASDLRVTLDTVEDALLLDGLTDLLGDQITGWRNLVDTLRSHPALVELNARVVQKSLEEG